MPSATENNINSSSHPNTAMAELTNQTIERIRNDFPILNKELDGMPIVYFDNSCMTLRPRQVIDAMNRYYIDFPACALRSHHKLSTKATEEVEKSRKTIQKFVGAKSEKEIIFTKNTTEGINLVANSLALSGFFKKGDVVLTTNKEHNSNLIPWQMLVKHKSITHKIVEFNDEFSMQDFEKKLTKEVRLVSMVWTSNLDGTSIPIKEIIEKAHANKSLVLIDAAQAAPHKKIDVKSLGADFISFSGHKMLGPSGTGIFYGKESLLNSMSPFIVGGETVKDSTYESADFEELPMKFEAGLQNYAGIIGLAAACDYLSKINLDLVEQHEKKLNKIITSELTNHLINKNYKRIKILGPSDPSQSEKRGGIFSFNIEGADPHNVAITLDSAHNIMLRSGHHCCHSWFNAKNINGSVRASLYLYNTEEEAEFFVEKVKEVLKVL